MTSRDIVTSAPVPFEPAPAAATHATAAPAESCANCGAEVRDQYCPSCGQRRVHADLTLREFLYETTHELTTWDGKVPQTLKALLFHPGLLTLDYFAGRRARWLAPLRLYLICSVVFFLSGPAVEAVTHRVARETARITITGANGSATLTPEMRRELDQSLLGRLFGADRVERAVQHSGELNRAMRSAYPKAMFVLLPLFALLTYVAWRGQRHRYPAHLYLALHLHAAWFLALTAVTLAAGFNESPIGENIIILLGGLYIAGYSLLALRAVFGESWGRTTGKAVAVAAAYLPCWFVVSLALLGYAIRTM